MHVDYDRTRHAFVVRANISTETIDIPFPLLDQDNNGIVFEDNPKDYDYKIFYKKDYKENDIFQVVEKSLKKRIGWIFPISSIISTSHDFVNNPHYCRYAFLAYMLLLQNEINEHKIVDHEFNIIIENEYSDAILLILKKELVKDITGFKIDNYYANLYKFGYYLEKRDTNPYIELSSNKKIVIQSISSDIASNDYIMRLFEILCKENHPIIKFHILYQVVELLIEDTLIDSLEKIIEQVKEKAIYVRSIREQVSKFESEKDRINIIVKKNCMGSDYNDLHCKCVSFLEKRGRKGAIEFPESIYAIRNYIVHDFRFIIDDIKLEEIDDINFLFEILVLDLIIKYKR